MITRTRTLRPAQGRWTRAHKLVGAVCALGLLACSACTSSGEDTDAKAARGLPSVAVDPKLRSVLPAGVRRSGTLTVASSFTTPPLYALGQDAETPTGIFVDLLENAGNHLGVKIKWRQIPFTGQIPALKSGKIDVAASQYTPNSSVLGAANIVGMIGSSLSLLIPAANPRRIANAGDTCGLRIALTRGAPDSLDVANDLKKGCRRAGRAVPSFTLMDAGDARTALRSGKVDGYVLSTPSCLYARKTDPKTYGIALKGAFKKQTAGILVSHEDTGLAKALAAAFVASMRDGTYRKIATIWDLRNVIPTAIELNGAPAGRNP